MADEGVKFISRLVRSSRRSAEEAAGLRGQISGLNRVIGAQERNITFLEGTVVEGQKEQAELTKAVSTSVLRQLRTFNIQAQQRQAETSSILNRNLALGIAAIGGIFLLTK